MANRALCAAVLLLGLFSVATAGRWWDFQDIKLQDIKLTEVETLLHGHQSKKEAGPAIVKVKYEVPERLHEDFVDKWMMVEKEAMDEKGLQIYDLKKSIESNTRFYTYGEWDSMKAFIDHMRSDYIKDFTTFLTDEDILVDVYFLMSVTEEKDLSKRHRHSDAKEDEDDVFFVSRYHVPPSIYEDFVDAWTDIAKDVWEEEGNVNYALRKYAANNHHWVVYSAWESMEDYQTHMESKTFQRLHDFLAKNDIMVERECLVKVGHQEERKV